MKTNFHVSAKTRLRALVPWVFLLTILSLFPALTAHAAPGDFLFATPRGPYNLQRPSGVAIEGASGAIYVVDSTYDLIQKFDSSGKLLLRWGRQGTGNGEFNSPYHVALDAAGNVYVTDMDNNRVQKFDSNGVYLGQWGRAGTGAGEFSGPRGITVDPAGVVYVADTGNNRVQKFDSNGGYLGQWGGNGTGNGQLQMPQDVAAGLDGKIYVADLWNNRIQIFDSGGTYLSQWTVSTPKVVTVAPDGTIFVVGGSAAVTVYRSIDATLQPLGIKAGVQEGQVIAVEDIAIDNSGSIIVADTGNRRIQIFTGSGNFLAQWCGACSGDALFNVPIDVAVDPQGNVYATDFYNHRVQQFDASLNYLMQWHQGLFYPMGIDVSRSGDVYVSDNEMMNVFRYDGSGTPLPWGGTYVPGGIIGKLSSPEGLAVAPSGNVYVADTGFGRIAKFDGNGEILAQIPATYPIAVGVDWLENVYVIDPENARVVKYDSSGQYLTQWGTKGIADGQFAAPDGVAIDLSGNVYVADAWNRNIQIFSVDGAFLGRLPARVGIEDGELWSPAGLAVTPTGSRLYVAEEGNNRILAFIGYGVVRFAVSAPAATEAGAQLSLTVTALDDAGNIVKGYAGTVHFTSSDGTALLPADITLTEGTGTFTATLASVGAQTITVADTVSPEVKGSSAPVTVLVPGVTDLRISLTHQGNFQQGQIGATYTITVTNIGSAPTTKWVRVRDHLPAGLEATAIGGEGWTCNSHAMICTRSDSLAGGASYPPITVTVEVHKQAKPLVTNRAVVSGGGDADKGNNVATDPTVVTP